MNVLVIGGSGFLGSHTADALTEAGYNVIIFDIVKSPYLQKNGTITRIIPILHINLSCRPADATVAFKLCESRHTPRCLSEQCAPECR